MDYTGERSAVSGQSSAISHQPSVAIRHSSFATYHLPFMRRLLTVASILSLLGLAACMMAPAPTTAPVLLAATPTNTLAAPLASPTPTPNPNAVRVWWPPAFAPGEATAGGQVLAQQIAAFAQAHPAITIDERLKQATGPGGLLTSLIAAYNAAPSTLPNLILLNRDDIEAAYHAGLLAPLEAVVDPTALADYYPFAQTLSRVDNAFVCLPFAADVRLMVYNTQTYAAPPLTWADVVTGPLVLPAAETSGLSLLSTYLSLGGALTSPSGQPVLDTEVLADALTLYQTAQASGVIPLSTLTYTDSEATWQVFRERRAALAFTSAHWYLAEHDRAAAAAASPLPTRDGVPFALAEGWCWAMVATPGLPQQQAAAELLSWLTAPEQLSAWALAADVLPPRAAAVKGWAGLSRARFADSVLRHAQLQPSGAVLARVGLPLQQALDDVLSGHATPIVAASAAAQAVAGP
jgi:ABC-type glycerol-3-phosphate transport system substrate-binding protein